MSIKQSYERIKDAVAWCCYDGKSLGVYENDFKVLAKALRIEKKTKTIRNFIVIFKKHKVYGNKRFNDNCVFCCKSLDSKAIKRPFENKYTVVDELIIKTKKDKKIIYKGNDYEEFKEKCL